MMQLGRQGTEIGGAITNLVELVRLQAMELTDEGGCYLPTVTMGIYMVNDCAFTW